MENLNRRISEALQGDDSPHSDLLDLVNESLDDVQLEEGSGWEADKLADLNKVIDSLYRLNVEVDGRKVDNYPSYHFYDDIRRGKRINVSVPKDIQKKLGLSSSNYSFDKKRLEQLAKYEPNLFQKLFKSKATRGRDTLRYQLGKFDKRDREDAAKEEQRRREERAKAERNRGSYSGSSYDGYGYRRSDRDEGGVYNYSTERYNHTWRDADPSLNNKSPDPSDPNWKDYSWRNI